MLRSSFNAGTDVEGGQCAGDVDNSVGGVLFWASALTWMTTLGLHCRGEIRGVGASTWTGASPREEDNFVIS